MNETLIKQRIDLDALEAALAKASLPDTMRILSATISLHPQGPDICSNDEQEAYFALAHNALPALIAEVRELRREAERARWCEENKADVSWLDTSRRWSVVWVAGGLFDTASGPDRSAAIDAARGGK